MVVLYVLDSLKRTNSLEVKSSTRLYLYSALYNADYLKQLYSDKQENKDSSLRTLVVIH